MDRKIQVSDQQKKLQQSLKAGDYVYLTGTIYTARDAAHKRMQEALRMAGTAASISRWTAMSSIIWDHLRQGKDRPIGSAGPTTASRMDKYAPNLLDLGLGAHDWKRKTQSRQCIDGSSQKRLCVLCGSRRSRRTAFQAHSSHAEVDRLRGSRYRGNPEADRSRIFLCHRC